MIGTAERQERASALCESHRTPMECTRRDYDSPNGLASTLARAETGTGVPVLRRRCHRLALLLTGAAS